MWTSFIYIYILKYIHWKYMWDLRSGFIYHGINYNYKKTYILHSSLGYLFQTDALIWSFVLYTCTTQKLIIFFLKLNWTKFFTFSDAYSEIILKCFFRTVCTRVLWIWYTEYTEWGLLYVNCRVIDIHIMNFVFNSVT
jgi:hypothetical protein